MGIENPGGKTSGSSSRTTKIINQMFFCVAAAPWKPPLILPSWPAAAPLIRSLQ